MKQIKINGRIQNLLSTLTRILNSSVIFLFTQSMKCVFNQLITGLINISLKKNIFLSKPSLSFASIFGSIFINMTNRLSFISRKRCCHPHAAPRQSRGSAKAGPWVGEDLLKDHFVWIPAFAGMTNKVNKQGFLIFRLDNAFSTGLVNRALFNKLNLVPVKTTSFTLDNER